MSGRGCDGGFSRCAHPNPIYARIIMSPVRIDRIRANHGGLGDKMHSVIPTSKRNVGIVPLMESICCLLFHYVHFDANLVKS